MQSKVHSLYLFFTANINSVKRGLQESDMDTRLNINDVITAMTTIQPSAMREIQLEIPKVSIFDISSSVFYLQLILERIVRFLL